MRRSLFAALCSPAFSSLSASSPVYERAFFRSPVDPASARARISERYSILNEEGTRLNKTTIILNTYPCQAVLSKKRKAPPSPTGLLFRRARRLFSNRHFCVSFFLIPPI